MMTNGYHEGQIFLSHPHTNNGFFFLFTTKYLILYWKHEKGFRKMLNTLRFDMVTSFEHYNNVTDQRATDMHLFVLFSVLWAGTGMWVKSTDISIGRARMSDWDFRCFHPCEIITIDNECPCRTEISHLMGHNFNQGPGLSSPWLNSDLWVRFLYPTWIGS